MNLAKQFQKEIDEIQKNFNNPLSHPKKKKKKSDKKVTTY